VVEFYGQPTAPRRLRKLQTLLLSMCSLGTTVNLRTTVKDGKRRPCALVYARGRMPGHLVGQIQRLLHAVLNLDSRWWFGWPPGSHLHMRVECSFLLRQPVGRKKAWPARDSLSCESLLQAVESTMVVVVVVEVVAMTGNRTQASSFEGLLTTWLIDRLTT